MLPKRLFSLKEKYSKEAKPVVDSTDEEKVEITKKKVKKKKI